MVCFESQERSYKVSLTNVVSKRHSQSQPQSFAIFASLGHSPDISSSPAESAMAAVTSAAATAAARIGAALSDAQYFESSMVRPEDIRRQLDSRSTKDKLDAMKRVIALISLGKDASMFFPDVVKNVVASSLDVKKLVYLYLVHYAEIKQDLALLAINSFQKDLSDPNQHIRALSLRVLSSIRVKVILQVVILAINNATKDSSAYVRKAAAHAISKVCALDTASSDMLMEPLKSLISDRSPQVLGSAIAAFDDVCPYNWSMIHPHYRRICHALSNVEPWGQIAITQMLLRYARTHFSKPKNQSSSNVSTRNSDLSLLLESVTPLFVSLNNSVVASAISLFFHLASTDEFRTNAVKPLMRLVATQYDGGQAVALHMASAIAVRFPDVLIPYVSEFYVSPAHSAPIRGLRVKVLVTICAAAGRPGGIGFKPDARRMLLAELKDYLFRSDKYLAASAAKAIGCLATAHPASTPAIVRVLSSVVASANNPVVVSESIAVLRRLLQRHPHAQTKALPQLIAMLLSSENSEAVAIRDPGARSSIIWLITEFYEKVQSIATEALRLLARGFVHEASEVKVQILNLAAKIVVWHSKESGLSEVTGDDDPSLRRIRKRLLEYVVSCARYDRDYDVRDKARIMHALFISNNDSPLFKAACKAYLSRKPITRTNDQSGTEDQLEMSLDSDVIIGSMAHVLTGRRLFGFRPLEPWADVDSDDVLRESTEETDRDKSGLREYIGVGNTPMTPKPPSVTSDPISWLTSQISLSTGTSTTVPKTAMGISSSDLQQVSRDSMFNGGLSSTGVRYAPVSNKTTQFGIKSGVPVDIDPEKFYSEERDGEDDVESGNDNGDDDDDEEYDDDDDDEDDDDDDNDNDNDGDDLRRNGRGTSQTDSTRAESSGQRLAIDASPVPNLPTASVENLLIPKDTSNAGPLPMSEFGQPKGSSKMQFQLIEGPRKPASEYDLDALLGGLSTTSSGGMNSAQNSNSFQNVEGKDRSPWFRVLEHWNCSGLEIDACYLKNSSPSGLEITPVIIRVLNRGKQQADAISLTSKCEDSFVSSQNIESLAPNVSSELHVDARFRGKTSGIKFDVLIEGNVVGEGELKPSIGYVVQPRPGISPGEVADTEKSLTGMFASEEAIMLEEPRQNNDWIKLSSDIRDKAAETCFLSHIKTSMGGQGTDNSGRFSIVFAGYLPSEGFASPEQRPVLVRVTVKALETEFGCKCIVWIGCEDVLFSANLMRLYKNILKEIDEDESK